MPDANNLTLAQKYLIFLFLIFKNVFSTSLGKRSRVETLSNLFLSATTSSFRILLPSTGIQ